MAPPLDSQYAKFVAEDDSYTIKAGDDIIVFTITGAETATLPLAKECSIVSGQNEKIIVNHADSTDPLTIAVQSGNTLVGATAPSATTLEAGETAFVYGNGVTIWNVSGGAGVSGVSGFSGFSGASGYSGASGFSGFSGKSGFSGYSGVSGFSGYSGISGASGYSGFSGISGYSGYSGASGFSGYSGVAP